MAGTAGTAMLDFGTFPGKSDASVAVTGQTAILGTSLVEAWVRPTNTEDHLSDEHLVESLRVIAGDIVAGTGFTIYGFNTSELSEPLERHRDDPTRVAAIGTQVRSDREPSRGGQGTRIWGRWGVAWAWSD